eukprot:7146400-Prymnesium_polylepis.1
MPCGVACCLVGHGSWGRPSVLLARGRARCRSPGRRHTHGAAWWRQCGCVGMASRAGLLSLTHAHQRALTLMASRRPSLT